VARYFAGTNQYIHVDSTPVVAAPFTMAGWGRPDNNSDQHCLLYLGDKDDGQHQWALQFAGGLSGDPVRAFVYAGAGTQADAESSTGYTAGSWSHAAYVEESSSSRIAYIDGGDAGTDSSDRSPAGADRLSIGRNGDETSPSAYMTGAVCWVALWDVALPAADIAWLAAGGYPPRLKRDNLVAFWPLGWPHKDNDEDIIGGYDMTAYNSPTWVASPSGLEVPAHICHTRKGSMAMSQFAHNPYSIGAWK